jgi:hypothetical protein
MRVMTVSNWSDITLLFYNHCKYLMPKNYVSWDSSVIKVNGHDWITAVCSCASLFYWFINFVFIDLFLVITRMPI